MKKHINKLIVLFVVILFICAGATRYNPFVQIIDLATGNKAGINDDGQLHVVLMGNNIESNSSQSTLGIGGEFQGTAANTLDYGFIYVTVFSDVASATDGLETEISSDGVTWRTGDVYSISANTEKTFAFQPNKKYFRVKYTNGGTEQGVFDIQTIFKKTSSLPSSHRIQDNITDEDDAQLVKAVLTGQDPAGTFRLINATEDGDLTISDNSSGLAIAEGNVTGKTFIHKFGFAADFDTADGLVTVWDGANDSLLGGGAMNYTYSSSADIDTISSSDNGDTQIIEIHGLDNTFTEVIQTKTLTGQTDAILDTPLRRVYRMVNRGSTDLAGVVYLRTNGSAQGSGVPSVANTVRAIINNGNNQTLMAVYTIPLGKTGYLRSWYASLSGAKKTSVHVVHLDARPDGEVFQLKHVSSLIAVGTSNNQHQYIEPEIFPAKTDIEMQSNSDEDTAAISAGFDIVLVDD